MLFHRFARARFGRYDLIDFVVVLIGYALSGEPTLKEFYARKSGSAISRVILWGAQSPASIGVCSLPSSSCH
jgi:hypothetical protein